MKQKPDAKKSARKSGQLTPDDLSLWQQVQRTVEPLAGKAKEFADYLAELESGEPDDLSRRKPSGNSPVSKPKPRTFPVAPYSPPVSKPAGGQSAIDDKTARKLLKGRLSIEDRIDLHGMTQDQAYQLLSRFLARSHAEGLRIVLVITGKGRMREGVLRQMVPQWLREPHLSLYVSAFRTAHVTHGGEGALYVRLRRNETRKGGK